MLQRELSPAKLTTHTYVGVPSGTGQTKVPLDINGVSIVQYTPYQGDDGCNQIAAVKIWVELKADPVRKRLLNQMPLSACFWGWINEEIYDQVSADLPVSLGCRQAMGVSTASKPPPS